MFARRVAVVMALVCVPIVGLWSVSTAQAYIGEGVQGRPHGGHAAQRYYNFRHGYGYTRYPKRYRR